MQTVVEDVVVYDGDVNDGDDSKKDSTSHDGKNKKLQKKQQQKQNLKQEQNQKRKDRQENSSSSSSSSSNSLGDGLFSQLIKKNQSSERISATPISFGTWTEACLLSYLQIMRSHLEALRQAYAAEAWTELGDFLGLEFVRGRMEKLDKIEAVSNSLGLKEKYQECVNILETTIHLKLMSSLGMDLDS